MVGAAVWADDFARYFHFLILPSLLIRPRKPLVLVPSYPILLPTLGPSLLGSGHIVESMPHGPELEGRYIQIPQLRIADMALDLLMHQDRWRVMAGI